MDFEVETFVTHALRGEGFDASEDGTGRGTPIVPVNVAPTLNAGGNRTGGDRQPGMSVDTADSLIPIAFSCKDYGNDATADLAPTLRSMGHDGSHQNGGGQMAIAIQAGALRTNPSSGPDGVGVHEDIAYTLEARAEVQAVAAVWAVRRLTPTECARLQGFPEEHCRITYRGKPAADGPIYKALGNSWAVPCGAWIIGRIAEKTGSMTTPTVKEQ